MRVSHHRISTKASLQHPDANAENNPAYPQYTVQTNSNHWFLFFNAAVTHLYSGLCRAHAYCEDHSCNFSFKIRQEEKELDIKPWLLTPLTVKLKRPIWFFSGHVFIVTWRGAMLFFLFGRGIRKDCKDFLTKIKCLIWRRKGTVLSMHEDYSLRIPFTPNGECGGRYKCSHFYLAFLVPSDFFSSWFSRKLIMQFLQEHLI